MTLDQSASQGELAEPAPTPRLGWRAQMADWRRRRRSSLRRLGAVGVDALLAAVAALAAYALRLDAAQLASQDGVLLGALVAFAATIVASHALHANEMSWRFVSAYDLPRLATVSASAAIAFTLFGYLTWTETATPRTVPLIFFALHFLFMGAARVGWRLAREGRERRKQRRADARSADDLSGRPARLKPPARILLVGSASSVDRLLRAHGAGFSHAAPAFAPIGRGEPLLEGVDDGGTLGGRRIAAGGAIVAERRFVGTIIRGTPVIGAMENIDSLLDEHGPGVEGVAFLEDSLRPSQGVSTLDVIDRAASRGLVVLKLSSAPRVSEAHADAPSFELAPLRIEDLLAREPRQLDLSAAAATLAGKTALITGGGGSVGSELCRCLAKLGLRRLVIVEANEFNLYRIEMELLGIENGPELRAAIGDVRDAGRMAQIFDEERPDVVFHAAALKHVPMVEQNRLEALRTNLFGARTVLDCALAHQVDGFVLVSTDKAVRSMSFMGVTKRLAERLVQRRAAALRPGDHRRSLLSVRFGNVLGSSGSVIPLFREQIARGGPVTVTHPDMERFFMTIPEAAALIVQSYATLSLGNEEDLTGAPSALILDMGKPVRIMDLAEQLIRLSGFKPHDDIPIEITGLRPAEKLYEELSYPEERLAPMADGTVVGAFGGAPVPDDFEQRLEALEALVESGLEDEAVTEALSLAPGHIYTPKEAPSGSPAKRLREAAMRASARPTRDDKEWLEAAAVAVSRERIAGSAS